MSCRQAGLLPATDGEAIISTDCSIACRRAFCTGSCKVGPQRGLVGCSRFGHAASVGQTELILWTWIKPAIAIVAGRERRRRDALREIRAADGRPQTLAPLLQSPQLVQEDAAMWTRRRVIFVGVAGVLAAGAAVVLLRLKSAGPAPAGVELVANHTDMLRAVALALLGPALPTAGSERDAQVGARTEGVRRADRQSACQHAS